MSTNSIYRRHPLNAIFTPQSVAVIGASEREGSVGRTLLRNLVSNPFGGTVYPINPKHKNVLGIHAYPSVADLPEQVDLAVIATPARTVPGIIEECVNAGVKGAIVISAGFKEIGEEGIELERQILEKARRAQMRIIGPNCLGVMNPIAGLNATFASGMANPGSVGFISQSGAMLTAILDWSYRENVGFSNFVSVGSMLEVNWGDLITYLGDDYRTKSIVIYMESIGDARSFLSAAREVSLTKPIIVIKSGRTEAAAQAAASHTGSLAGSDEVLDAAFQRSGVLRVERIAEVFAIAEVLAKQPHPKGPNLTIVTNAGGPGVIATDALIQTGGQLTELSEQTVAGLDELLPPHWSRHNPIDILGDASPERYAETLKVAASDPGSDALLVALTPQDMTDPTQTATQLQLAAKETKKPILASWMGGIDIAPGTEILNRANIPTFDYPDTAARIFTYMWKYTYNLRSIYETPSLSSDANHTDAAAKRQMATKLIDEVRQKKRSILTEYESKEILAAYDIPTVETVLATSVDEAIEEAARIGYPVVLKLNSETVTHKTDAQGVQLNLANDEAVREAFERIEQGVTDYAGEGNFQGVTVQPMVDLSGYELIIGSSPDTQFGPVLLFGTGGTLVEVFKDRALALPPLNSTLAHRMMEQTKIFEALQGVRGRAPVDLDELASLLVRFSHLVVEQPWIKEIDINPLLASAERLLALDARIVLHDPETETEDLPQLAIRPYPTQYIEPWSLPNGTELTIRPIRPEDEPLMADFNRAISPDSLYLRYFSTVSPSHLVSHDELTRLCFIDYDRAMTLVAEKASSESSKEENDKEENGKEGNGKEGNGNGREIIAMGQLVKLHGSDDAEFAILVSDQYQRTGLGTELLTRLLDIGRDEGIERIVAEILPQNEGMKRVCRKLGFDMKHNREDHLIEAVIEL